jgi:sodium-dependent dicarboxylate transporter 2/3/5
MVVHDLSILSLNFILSCMQQANCAFVVLLMGAYWVTNVMPLAITSLIPIVLFPLLGIMNSRTVATFYMSVSASGLHANKRGV